MVPIWLQVNANFSCLFVCLSSSGPIPDKAFKFVSTFDTRDAQHCNVTSCVIQCACSLSEPGLRLVGGSKICEFCGHSEVRWVQTANVSKQFIRFKQNQLAADSPIGFI